MEIGDALLHLAQLAKFICDENEALKAENEELEQSNYALTQKLNCEIRCGCSYDRPDDICMAHLPIFTKLEAENEQLQDKLSETVIHLAARNSEIEQLKAKLDKAKDALNWYADKTNYPKPEWFSPIVDDQGQRSRTTLEEIG